MADTKITALAAITSVVPSTFPIPIVDLNDTSMASTGTTKKVTVNQILGAGGTATLASATITGDLTVDTSTLKVDSANNRVGIGTASPSHQLTVSGTAATNTTGLGLIGTTTGYNRVLINNTSGGCQFGVEGSTGGSICNSSTAYSTIVGSYQNYPLHLITNNNVQATLDTSGNLGLNTAPSYKLHVVRSTDGITAGFAGQSYGIRFDNGGAFSTGGSTIHGVDQTLSSSYQPLGLNGSLLTFSTGATERARFNGTGAFVLAGGNTSANGIGISFPATQVASSDANTLDDYEEGTWTPELKFGGNNTGMTYTIQAARYIKIGRQVTVNCFILLSAKGSSTGSAFITGLPFTSANATAAHYAGSIRVDGVAFSTVPQCYIGSNSSSVVLESVATTASPTVMSDTSFTNSSVLILTIEYSV